MDISNHVWQAMQEGAWYLAHAPELRLQREHASQWCWAINQPNQTEQTRNDAFKQLLPNVSQVDIGEQFACDFGVNIFCDGPLRIKNNVVILDHNKVNLGKHVVIEEGVVIATVSHPLEEQQRKAGWQQAHAIHIGNHVTIGAHCSVLPGASIPHNTNVPPGTVVTASMYST